MIFIKSIFAYTGYGIAMILWGYVGNKSLVNMYYSSLIPIIINLIVLLLLEDIKSKSSDTIKYKAIIKEAIVYYLSYYKSDVKISYMFWL